MLKQLPLILMMLMIVIGLIMEDVLFGRLQWISKIPVVLLLLAFVVFRKRGHAASR